MGREKFLPCGPSYIDYRLFAFLFFTQSLFYFSANVSLFCYTASYFTSNWVELVAASALSVTLNIKI